MKHVRTIKDYVRTTVRGASCNIDIICDEYVTILKFVANVRDYDFPIEQKKKKREYKNYELARQHFLAELYTKALQIQKQKLIFNK